MQSISSSAQYTENMEIDVTALTKLREVVKDSFEKNTGLKLTFTYFFVILLALALKEFPMLNATFEEGKIKVFDEINIGVAFALKDGLIVPVVKNVETKKLGDIARDLDNFSRKIASGTLTLEDVSNGTFTITNVGMYGVDSFTPIINIPQVAILGINRIVRKPVVIDEKIEIRSTMNLSLTSDHRIVDGAVSAQFLNKLATTIKDE